MRGLKCSFDPLVCIVRPDQQHIVDITQDVYKEQESVKWYSEKEEKQAQKLKEEEEKRAYEKKQREVCVVVVWCGFVGLCVCGFVSVVWCSCIVNKEAQN